MEEDRIRLRLHWGGNFQPLGPPQHYQWRYVGGEVFNASVPANSHYADLCLKLNDTVGYTTSVKYQAPGEELVPDELVSITGEDDLQELYDEYRSALRRPGKPFRVKMFLFPALQTELETDVRAAEAHPQPFNPEEWYIGEEHADDEATLGDEATLSCLLSDTGGKIGWQEDMDDEPSSTDPSCAHSEMLWEQPQYLQQPQSQYLQPSGPGLGLGFGLAGGQSAQSAPRGAAFADRPPVVVVGGDRSSGGAGGDSNGCGGGGLFGSRQSPSGGEQQQQLFQGLDQYAFGNLMQSITRSTVMQRPTGITEEMDLLDPYHEQDDSLIVPQPLGNHQASGAGALFQQQQQPRASGRGAGQQLAPAPTAALFQQPAPPGQYGAGVDGLDGVDGPLNADGDHMTALVRLQEHLSPKGVSDNRYGSLVGNLPSHISIFGSDGGQGGRALSAGADGNGMPGAGAGGSAGGGDGDAGACGGKWAGVQLPSHISVFGSGNHDDGRGEEGAEEVVEGRGLRRGRGGPAGTAAVPQDSKCLTQEFSRDNSLVLGTPGAGVTPAVGARLGGGAGAGGAYGGQEGAKGIGGRRLFAPEQLQIDGADGAGAANGGGGNGAGGGGGGGCDSPPASTPKLLEEVVQVPVSDVQIIRKIGEGAFGEVSLANVSSHGLVAIKWLKKDRFAKYSESFMREAEVLAKLNHPNIIRMYGVVIEPVEGGHSHAGGSTLLDSSSGASGRGGGGGGSGSGQQQGECIIAGIMTDYVRGGSLSGQLRAASRRPTLKERCQIAVQASRGMAFLHAQNPAVIHFDLKPDNLLVDGDGAADTLHVKVADFGLSKHKFQTFVSCRDLRGTLPYMAPELVSSPNQVSERCDVWSMGVVMWEMYTLQSPYSELSAQQILMALMHGSIHLHVPSSCEPEWRGLIEMCMDPKPETRPSFRQLTIILDKMLRQL